MIALLLAAALAADAPAATAAAIGPDVCNPTSHTVRTQTLVAYLTEKYKTKLTRAQVVEILSKPLDPDGPDVDAHPELLRMAADLKQMLNGGLPKAFRPSAPVTIQGYFKYYLANEAEGPDKASYPIACVTKEMAANPPSETSTPGSELRRRPQRPEDKALAGLRVRGTPGDLSITRTEGGYTGASKASFTLSGNEVTKVTTAQVQGAVGWAIPLDKSDDNILVPYVAGDYNESKTFPKSAKRSVAYADVGVQENVLLPLGHDGFWTLSLAPDYLHNYVNGSSIVSLHPILAPTIKGFTNAPVEVGLLVPGLLPARDYKSPADATLLTLLFDVRGDFGVYPDRGLPSARAADEDFARVGAKFGIDIAKKNWFDVTIAEVQLYGPEGSARHAADFESALTLYFGKQNIVGLTASYKSGLIEQTLQKEQIWSLGLTAKY
jgi:hypothetical protein